MNVSKWLMPLNSGEERSNRPKIAGFLSGGNSGDLSGVGGAGEVHGEGESDSDVSGEIGQECTK